MAITTRLVYFDLARSATKTALNDLELKENEEVVLESIANILETEPSGKIYKKRTYGTKLDQFLFEPVDTSTGIRIMEQVEFAIAKNEPRAQNVVVKIVLLHDENTFEINVSFETDVSERALTLQTTLKKIR